jgi:hypothetical protein
MNRKRKTAATKTHFRIRFSGCALEFESQDSEHSRLDLLGFGHCYLVCLAKPALVNAAGAGQTALQGFEWRSLKLNDNQAIWPERASRSGRKASADSSQGAPRSLSDQPALLRAMIFAFVG